MNNLHALRDSYRRHFFIAFVLQRLDLAEALLTVFEPSALLGLEYPLHEIAFRRSHAQCRHCSNDTTD